MRRQKLEENPRATASVATQPARAALQKQKASGMNKLALVTYEGSKLTAGSRGLRVDN